MGTPTPQTVTVYKGQTKTWRVPVSDEDGAAVNLTTVDEIEFQVKRRAGNADPPLISKSLGDGVTVLDQTDPDTLGSFEIRLEASDTSGMDEGVYRYDVVLIAGSDRQYIVPSSKFNLLEVVNNA